MRPASHAEPEAAHEVGTRRWRWVVPTLALLPSIAALMLLLIALRARIEFGRWPPNPFADGVDALPNPAGYYPVEWRLTLWAFLGNVYTAPFVPIEFTLNRRWRWLTVYVVGWAALGWLVGSDADLLAWFFD